MACPHAHAHAHAPAQRSAAQRTRHEAEVVEERKDAGARLVDRDGDGVAVSGQVLERLHHLQTGRFPAQKAWVQHAQRDAVGLHPTNAHA